MGRVIVDYDTSEGIALDVLPLSEVLLHADEEAELARDCVDALTPQEGEAVDLEFIKMYKNHAANMSVLADELQQRYGA